MIENKQIYSFKFLILKAYSYFEVLENMLF